MPDDFNDIRKERGDETVVKLITNAERVPANAAATVDRLAAMPRLEYEQVRKDEAKKLGVRSSTLDDEVRSRRDRDAVTSPDGIFPEATPWPEPVDGALLMEEIYRTIKRFIVCEEETMRAATAWIAFTWFIDHVEIAPIAVITAPEKRCGKSQLLDLIGRLSRKPLMASNISPAAIFRVVEAHGPTLLIDEADSFLKDNEEARGILGGGHSRSAAYVWRVVGDDHEPKPFSTWGAKAISGIGKLPETIMDRAVLLELRRKLPGETVQRLRHADKGQFKDLAAKLARYAQDHGAAIEIARPMLPYELNDRAQDNWEPLLAIADHVGGEWPVLARKAAVKLSGAANESVSLSAELLTDIRDIFSKPEFVTADRISTAVLLQELTADHERPWAAFDYGKPMTPRQLGKHLTEYGIKSETLRFMVGTLKGYRREVFTDAFNRYLSKDLENAVVPVPPVTASATDATRATEFSQDEVEITI